MLISLRDADPGRRTACSIRSGAIMALYIVARSTWRGGGRVEWRGRTYGTGGAIAPSCRPADPPRRCCAGMLPPSTRPAESTLRWNSTLPIARASESAPSGETFALDRLAAAQIEERHLASPRDVAARARRTACSSSANDRLR